MIGRALLGQIGFGFMLDDIAPRGIGFTPDGKKLYVACGRGGVVSLIDTESNTKLSDISVGKLPWGVVIR